MDENFNRAGVSENVGRIATGMGSARIAEHEEQERKRREENAERARLIAYLAELDRRIGELDDLIDRLNRQIAELNERIDMAQSVLDAIAAGEYDPENPEHRAFLERWGIDPDQPADAIEEQLQPRMDRWRVQRGDRLEERDNAEREREELQRERNESHSELDNAQAGPEVASAEARIGMVNNTASARSADVELLDLDEEQGDEFDSLLAGIDEVALTDEEYPSYADEIDPAGAVQSEPAEEASEPNTTQPDNLPEPIGPRMGG